MYNTYDLVSFFADECLIKFKLEGPLKIDIQLTQLYSWTSVFDLGSSNNHDHKKTDIPVI